MKTKAEQGASGAATLKRWDPSAQQVRLFPAFYGAQDIEYFLFNLAVPVKVSDDNTE